MSIDSVMPSSHLILCRPLLLPSIFPSIRVFSKESVLRIRWPKYWEFQLYISPSNEYSGLISFRIDWFDLAVQGTLKSLLQHHSSKASILWCLVFFIVQLQSWLPCPSRLGWGITSSKKPFLFSFVFPEPFWLYLHGLCLIMFMVITTEAAAAICFYVPDTRSCLYIHCLI